MLANILYLAISLFLVIKGATLATKYSAKLAVSFSLSKYIVGFMVVAFISILPETFIAINSSLEGIPAFGLGTLFGSNVADLTLVFAIIIISAGRGIKIESKILKKIKIFPLFLILPLVLGFNGHFSRFEGMLLIIVGAAFYYFIFKTHVKNAKKSRDHGSAFKNFLLLIFSLTLLLVGSHLAVVSASALALALFVNPILIGMLVVGLGTTMPELFFSLKSLKNKNDGLAIGDILGTVMADATIVVGILALIAPFAFPVKIIYVTGGFMVVASLILIKFISSGRLLSKKEGYALLLFWLGYVLLEIIANSY